MVDSTIGRKFQILGASHDSTGMREKIQHRLKSWPEFFEPILAGLKTHELRRNDDRDFQVGDTLLLQEFDPKSQQYSGRELVVVVTYITSTAHPCALSGAALHPDYCILSIRKES